MDDVLGSRPVVNAMSALQGAMPGLQITPNNDAAGPGQSKSFNIRGTTSINGGGPLVLIDNVPGGYRYVESRRYRKCFCVERCRLGRYLWCACRFRCNTCDYKKAKERRRVFMSIIIIILVFRVLSIVRNRLTGWSGCRAYLDGEFNAGKYYTGQDIKTWMNYLTEYRRRIRVNSRLPETGIYVDPETGLNYYLNEKDLYANMLDDYGFLQAHNVSLSGGTDKLAYRLSLGYNSEQGIFDHR